MNWQSAEVWFVDLTACASALLAIEHATPRLSRLDWERAARMMAANAANAEAWVAGRTALRCLIENRAGPDAGRSEFDTSGSGRPTLPNYGVTFSVSHTDGAMLIALSPAGALGVDIEAKRTVRMSEDRRRRIEDAARGLSRSAPLPVSLDDRFLQAWVRIEAFAKANGQGLSRVLADAAAYGPSFRHRALPALSQGGITTADLDLPAPYRGALALDAIAAVQPVRYFPASLEDVQAMIGYQKTACRLP